MILLIYVHLEYPSGPRILIDLTVHCLPSITHLQEVADPLMDLKQGVEDLQKNKTFKVILSVLLSVGNFLNGSESRGFQIDYLSKVPEVKDTVHKHSLLHHLCHLVIEKFPDTTDLYSEVRIENVNKEL